MAVPSNDLHRAPGLCLQVPKGDAIRKKIAELSAALGDSPAALTDAELAAGGVLDSLLSR